MQHEGSKTVLIIGMIANLAIMVLKFIASAFTGSTAMLAEAFHSTADTLNQLFLYIGMRQSKKPASSLHQFGYGSEQYFFAFVVALSIFSVGGVFSVYEGIHKILDPHPIENIYWAYGVLVGAIVFETLALRVAWKEFSRIQKKMNLSVVKTILESKDPTIITVVFEDSAALVGLVFALIGITLSMITQNAIYDGIASVCIGLILISVAIFLGKEVHSLLLGESLSKSDQTIIREIISKTKGIRSIVTFRSLYIGPEDVLLTLELEFEPHLKSSEAARIIDSIESQVIAQLPYVKQIYIEVEHLRKALV